VKRNGESDLKEQVAPVKQSRFFYGYIIVAAGFFISMMTQGVRPVYSVFFKPMQADFGWSRTLTSGAFSVSVAMEGILSILMGHLNDKYGPRIVMTVCGILIGLGYILMSYITSDWQLYLLYGVVIGIGLGGSIVPLMSSVVKWFTKRRSMMTGIVLTGSGLGSLIMPPIAESLISLYGWRTSYLILGGAVLAVIVIAGQFLRDDPGRMGWAPYTGGKTESLATRVKITGVPLSKALQAVQFWILFGMLLSQGFTIWAVTVHFVPYITDFGISASTAALIMSVRGAAMVAGLITFGNLADRVGIRNVNIAGFAIMAAALVLLLLSREIWGFFLFFFLIGFGNGALATTTSPLAAEFFGLRSHGIIFGTLGMAFMIGAGLGPVIAGYVFDTTASYVIAFVVALVMGFIGLSLSITLSHTKTLAPEN